MEQRDLEQQKWEFAKGLFAVVLGQQVLIGGLSKMVDQHWQMLVEIGRELGIKFSEQPPTLDAEAMGKMTEGVRQLERMFGFTEGDKPVN
jgi:hypothetical protein